MKEKDTSLEAMERLAKIMNDSPTVVKMSNTEFAIKPLRMGTQWKIAQKACEINKAEQANMTDIVRQFANNIPSVVDVLTLSILNDKDRIDSDEYKLVYDTIMWETNHDGWIQLLVEVLQMINVDFFLQITQMTNLFKEMTLTKKTTRAEAELLSQEAK